MYVADVLESRIGGNLFVVLSWVEVVLVEILVIVFMRIPERLMKSLMRVLAAAVVVGGAASGGIDRVWHMQVVARLVDLSREVGK
jgi:lipoprotein signal peptidase